MVISALVDSGLRLSTSIRRGTGLVVVTYHRVLEAPDPMLSEPDVKAFRAQVTFLARHLRVLPLREALQRLASGSLPDRAVSITFDDGYANNYSCALPVLRSLGMPATVFVATGYLNGGCMWNDAVIETFRRCRKPVLDLGSLGPAGGLGRYELGSPEQRRAGKATVVEALKYLPLPERTALARSIAEIAEVTLPVDLMLTSDEVRGFRREGFEIGGHTVNHPILARVTHDEARREICDGADQLEAITGERPQLFAYPNGRPGLDFGPEHAAMVKDAGFSHALTTKPGIGRPDSDPYALPRIALWARTAARLTTSFMSLYARSR
ncbi:MAG: polysaccharide deacetylase family protein [Gammaproteobacteria bacterium]